MINFYFYIAVLFLSIKKAFAAKNIKVMKIIVKSFRLIRGCSNGAGVFVLDKIAD